MLALEGVDVGAAARGYRLRDLSLALAPGELLAVLGPNGAGKSTLVALLGGTLAPDAGRVTLDGRDLATVPALALARRRAVLPQENALGFRFRVEEVVALGRSPHAGCGRAVDREAIKRALERADIAALARRDYTTLSGGERQRVHLARVLAQLDAPTDERVGHVGPRYLLLDEPTAALDLAHQHAVLALARTLSREPGAGIGVLAVLHDPNLAALHADRVAILERGRLRALGAPVDVFDASLFERVFGLAVDVLPHPRHPHRPLVVAGGRPAPHGDRSSASGKPARDCA